MNGEIDVEFVEINKKCNFCKKEVVFAFDKNKDEVPIQMELEYYKQGYEELIQIYKRLKEQTDIMSKNSAVPTYWSNLLNEAINLPKVIK